MFNYTNEYEETLPECFVFIDTVFSENADGNVTFAVISDFNIDN